MTLEAALRHAPRVARARADLQSAGLEALVVSHLPNIRYLTGFNGSAGVLLILQGSTELVVDFRYGSAARAAVAAGAGSPDAVTVLVAPASVDAAVAERLLASAALRVGIESHWMSVARFNGLAAALAAGGAAAPERPTPTPSLVTTERLIERARAVKDAWEIAILREAGRRLAAVADRVPALAQVGRTEIEVAAAIDALIREAGFERPAFETIVASGPNGALPHARPGPRRLAADEGVVLDFGGVYDGYCVDLTRTVELGSATREWRRMVDAVAGAQQAAIAAVRPGVTASEVDAAARDLLSRHGLGEAFGHGTGHGLGLEVHEEPRIGRRLDGQTDPVLEPGMIFTIEPGVYVDGVGGVRIEDDVLVTSTGCDVLTRP